MVLHPSLFLFETLEVQISCKRQREIMFCKLEFRFGRKIPSTLFSSKKELIFTNVSDFLIKVTKIGVSYLK